MLSRRAAVAMLFLGLILLLSAALFSLGTVAGPAAPIAEPAVPEETAAELPSDLHLQWVRDLPPLRPAWPDQPTLQYDVAYQPVVAGKTLFLASSRADGVAAFAAETGDALWRFFTDGPVRFAPVVWQDKVYFASDDGWLYCIAADSGALVWKFRGGPSDRKILGNGRLISTWPARRAPCVVEEPDGEAVVYFAAGIWPFMGVFLHALDARTGAVRWTNDGDGSIYIKQPHQVDSFAGVAPQGRLVAVGDRLLVPGGRSVPACYDRHTGKLLHFRLADNSKYGGGANVLPGRGFFVNGDGAFELTKGTFLGVVGDHAVLANDVLYTSTPAEVLAYDVQQSGRPGWKPKSAVAVALPGVTAVTAAGSRLYAADAGRVFAVALPLAAGKPRVVWEAPVEGRTVHLLAADGRLFVSTREGRLYCFGAETGEAEMHRWVEAPLPHEDDDWAEKAHDLLAASGAHDGYCISWGVGSGRLISELLRQSRLQIVAVEPDAEKAEAFRSEMCDAGLYGERVAVVTADPDEVVLPPYLAELMVSEDLNAAKATMGVDFIRKAFASLRPYGGAASFPNSRLGTRDAGEFASHIADAGLVNAEVRNSGEWSMLIRQGPLPGAADWTHEHADAANTRVSRDRIVKAPLGLLWFGGPSHDGILPRHGHGPQPQVVGGRLFIEGVDFLRAVDVYTGRLLWETNLPGLGKAYDKAVHQPGANAGGSNYVSAPDGIYIAYGTNCVRLDPADGRQIASYTMAPFPGEKGPPVWDWVTLAGAYLIGGANPSPTPILPHPRGEGREGGAAAAVSASKRLTVFDRNTRQPLWSITAQTSFRHNGICAGAGRLYAIDRTSADQLGWLTRRGDSPAAKPRLMALDLQTGNVVWKATESVFGSWLSYSEKYDILIEAGRNARDTLSDEPKGMRAYRGDRGNPLWYQAGYSGPAMIHGDMVLRDGGGCDLRTGAPTMHADPLTGAAVEWAWSRNYGCNTPAASENLLTFRSGAAGYYDLCNDGGTGNLGGFRSSCTNNLIVADGVLNAPDYTRGCTCSYQEQSSLALTPMPEAEMWTFFTAREVKGVVRRVGVNLGAPGARKADDGTLWLEYPPVGGPEARPKVTTSPANPDWFRRHSSQVTSDGPPWVGASGAKGLRSLSVTLARDPAPERPYTVRLYFMEPDNPNTGRRVFDVALQGRPVLKEFEANAEAGGPNRVVMKECKGVRVGRELTVTLTPAGPDTTSAPLLSAVEVVAEGW